MAVKVIRAADELAGQVMTRFEALKTNRYNYEKVWQEIRELIYPSGPPITATETEGTRTRFRVYDNTAEQLSEQLAAGLHAMLTNPSQMWFSLTARGRDIEIDKDGLEWLEEAGRRVMDAMASPISGFTTAIHSLYLELVNFGNACIMVQDQGAFLPPMFRARSMANIFWDEDSKGRVDTVFWHTKMTARQAVQEFGENNVGKYITQANAKPSATVQTFDFIHAVMPITDVKDALDDRRNFTHASIWVAMKDKKVVRRSGFDGNPYVTPRWHTRPDERYGRGPSQKALPDVKMLQRSMRATIRGAEKVIDPPLMMADDGILSPINIDAKGYTTVRADLFYEGRKPIVPLEAGSRPDIGEEFNDNIRNRVANTYLAPLMSLSRDPRMTATQSLQIQEEQFRGLSPILGRREEDLLGPLVGLTFAVMDKNGQLGERPEGLDDDKIKIEFISPVVKAQRISEVRAVAQTMDVMTAPAQADPTIIRNQDWDKTYRHVAERLGVPSTLLRDPAQVKAERQAAEQAARDQRELDRVREASVAAKNMAPVTEQAAQGNPSPVYERPSEEDQEAQAA